MMSVKKRKWSFGSVFSFIRTEPIHINREKVKEAKRMIASNNGIVSLPEVKVSGSDRFATLRKETEQLFITHNAISKKMGVK